MDAILTEIVELLRATAPAGGALAVGPDTPLVDLGLQSPDFLDLLFELETRFGIELAYERLDEHPSGTAAELAALVRLHRPWQETAAPAG